MKKTKQLNAERLFKNACSFCDVAEICEIENSLIDNSVILHNVPSIVNSVFACEIFLKCLLVKQNYEEFKNIHNLCNLWKMIKVYYNNKCNDIENTCINFYYSEGEKVDKKIFVKKMKSIGNSFVQWRYAYEFDELSLDRNFIKFFRIVLRNFCCEEIYNKSWSDYIKKE